MKKLPESFEKWLLNQISAEELKIGKQQAENNIMNASIMLLNNYLLLNLVEKRLGEISSRNFIKDAAAKVKDVFKSKEEKDAERYAELIREKIEDSKINNDNTGPVAETSTAN